MRVECYGTQASDDVFRRNVLLRRASGIIDRQEVERVILFEGGLKGSDVFILQEPGRSESVRLVNCDDAAGKATCRADNSRYLCRVMRKVVDYMHVLPCPDDGKPPGYSLVISHRIGKR